MQMIQVRIHEADEPMSSKRRIRRTQCGKYHVSHTKSSGPRPY